MGFIVARVMHFYGWSYWEALDTPVRAFWPLHRNIERLKAEGDLRTLESRMMAQASSKELLEQYQARLKSEMGLVVLEVPTFDRQGLQSIKGMNTTA